MHKGYRGRREEGVWKIKRREGKDREHGEMGTGEREVSFSPQISHFGW